MFILVVPVDPVQCGFILSLCGSFLILSSGLGHDSYS